jgi:hypothetical protein
MFILLYLGIVSFLIDNGIGIYGDLFHSTASILGLISPFLIWKFRAQLLPPYNRFAKKHEVFLRF